MKIPRPKWVMLVQIRLGLQEYCFIMETRNIAVIIKKKAKERYYSNNQSLKEVALQAFSKEELEAIHFSKITCFEDVCSVLGLNYILEVGTWVTFRIETVDDEPKVYHKQVSSVDGAEQLIEYVLSQIKTDTYRFSVNLDWLKDALDSFVY